MKKAVALLFAGIFLFSLASAIDTEINIRTFPDYKVSIFVLQPSETYYLLDSFHLNTDANGETSAVYTGEESSIKITVKVYNEIGTLALEKFGEFQAGSPLYLQVKPGAILSDYKKYDEEKAEEQTTEQAGENVTETQQEEETTGQAAPQEEMQTETTLKQNPKITGNTISTFGKVPLKSFYYIIGIIAIAAAAIFMIMQKRRYAKKSAVIAALTGPKKTPAADTAAMQPPGLDELEKKVKSLQVELATLKNKEKIAAAQRKLEEDRREIERLQSGEL